MGSGVECNAFGNLGVTPTRSGLTVDDLLQFA